jgi:hypothetical protein
MKFLDTYDVYEVLVALGGDRLDSTIALDGDQAAAWSP